MASEPIETKRSRVPRWLPNGLSALRLALIPVWLALAIIARERALEGLEVQRGPLLWVLFVIGLTDVLDGTLARRLGLASHLGAMMDAIADKFATLFAVTFLTFFALPAFTPLPIWLWAVLMARDFALLLGVVMLRLKNKPIDSSHVWEGRMATLLLFSVVVMACWAAPSAAVTAGSLVVVGLVMAGMWHYVGRGLATLKARAHRQLQVPPHATPGHR